MHRKLALVPAVLAIVTGSASAARAAAPPGPVPGVAPAPRPAAALGRGGTGARRPDVPAIPVTAYVANEGSGTVTPITTATNTAGHPITTGKAPEHIAITPDGTTAYVLSRCPWYCCDC